MEGMHPGWIVAGIVGLFILWANQRLRALLIFGFIVFLVIAALKTITRSEYCPGGGDCLIELQPTWAGPCFPSNGGAVLKTDGRYYLTAEADAAAGATCLDWRVWR